MFAPPICRRRWRNNAFPFRQIQRRRRQPANIAASGASKFDPRCSRRRSAGGDGGTTLFRSARSNEDGGNQRTSQRAERANSTRDVRAADLQEEMAEQRFSVPPDPTKTAATSEHRSERSEQIRPAMFAPPSCRRRWRNNASPFRQIRRRRRQPANIAASGASKLDPRCSRRAAGGDGGTTLLRSARSDEDGGNQRTSQRAERAN